ncbi:hypothetical protein KQH27_00650 [bacterium]|nr:hypothetical protein [bacterium]
MDSFSTFDLCKQINIPRERLREWINRGYVRPSIQRAQGVGTKSLFSRIDAFSVILFKYLIEKLRVYRETAAQLVAKWLEQVNEEGKDPMAEATKNVMFYFKDSGIDSDESIVICQISNSPDGDLVKFDSEMDSIIIINTLKLIGIFEKYEFEAV